MYIRSNRRILTIECYEINDEDITPPEDIAEKVIRAGQKDIYGYYQVKNIDDCIKQAVKWEHGAPNRTVLATIYDTERRMYIETQSNAATDRQKSIQTHGGADKENQHRTEGNERGNETIKICRRPYNSKTYNDMCPCDDLDTFGEQMMDAAIGKDIHPCLTCKYYK